MCLAIPAKIISRDGENAVVDLGGVRRTVSAVFVDTEAKPGAWVLVHTGFALEIISEEEARQTIEAMDEAFVIGTVQES